MAIPELRIETDGDPRATKVVMVLPNGDEWDVSSFCTRIVKPDQMHHAYITLVGNCHTLGDGPELVVDANDRQGDVPTVSAASPLS